MATTPPQKTVQQQEDIRQETDNMFVIVLFAVFTLCQSASIPHSIQTHHKGGATSYQHVQISNYHPVPVYIKHEHQQLLRNPVPIGHTAHKVQVHHPETQPSHDHGYAIVTGTHQQHQQQDDGYGQGQQGYEQQGYEQQGYEQQGYEQHGQQQEDEGAQQDLGHYSQAELSGAGLQAYATHEGGEYSQGQDQGQEYEQEAAGYEHGGEDAQQHYQ